MSSTHSDHGCHESARFSPPPADDLPPGVLYLRMNAHLTEIALILDRSGSMETCADAAIAGFNEFLATQRLEAGIARMSLILFDDRYETPYSSLPLSEIVDLDHKTFVPRGTTALLDAIGRTIDELGNRLAQLPESDRPGLVIVAILTDGFENSSHTYSWRDISERIAHQRDAYNWKFLFLAANQDAIATAARIHIGAHDSASFAADAPGAKASFKSASRKTSAMRKFRVCSPMTPSEQEDLGKSLGEIVQEDDSEERRKNPPSPDASPKA